jgi:hypothetical protein
MDPLPLDAGKVHVIEVELVDVEPVTAALTWPLLPPLHPIASD